MVTFLANWSKQYCYVLEFDFHKKLAICGVASYGYEAAVWQEIADIHRTGML